MVQVLRANPQKSGADRFAEAFANMSGTLGESIPQHLMAQEAQGKETSALQQILGKDYDNVDWSGVSPEFKKVLLQETLKQRGKESLLSQKEAYLNKLFGGQSSSSREDGDPQQEGMSDQSSMQGTGKFDASSISDEAIARAAAIDPNIARNLQHAKDVSLREKRAELDSDLKNKRFEENLDYQSFKDNKDYIEKVLNGYEGYKRDKLVLDQMDALVDKGNLPKPLGVSLLNKIGIPLGVLENPDAEQFEKLSQELMKNIQGTYGSRILQTEVQNFLKSIPSLMNSTEGQKKLIRQWKILNEGKKAYYEAYKQIKKENPKRLPQDLHEKVIENVEPLLDRLSNEFKAMNQSSVRIRAPDGSIRLIPYDMLDSAIQAGGEYIQ